MKLQVISNIRWRAGIQRPLLLEHGMLQEAWCWDVHFLDYFAHHRFAALGVNPRGHGSSDGRDTTRRVQGLSQSSMPGAQEASTSVDR